MISYLYAVVGAVCLFVTALLAYFTYDLRKQEGISKKRTPIVFVHSAFYCFIEMIWGLYAAGFFGDNLVVYLSLTIIDLLLNVVVSYLWLRHTSEYLDRSIGKVKHILSLVPIFISVVLLFTTPFNGLVFSIGADMSYHAGIMRWFIFVCIFFYLACSIAVTAMRLKSEYDLYTRNRLKYAIAYLALIFFFTLMQLSFPNAPMSPIGYMFADMVAFVGIISKDRERRIIESSDFYQETSVELYKVLEALGKSYVSIHVFDLDYNIQTPYKSTKFVDAFIDPLDDAATQIRKVMEGVTRRDYTQKMVDFVDVTTLPERMKGKEVISKEFIGKNEGWCMSTFIRMDEEGDELKKVVHAVMNIDEAKKIELEYSNALKRALEDENVIYAEIMKAQLGGIIASDIDDNIVIINDAAARFFGYDNAESTPGHVYELMKGCEIEQAEKNIQALEKARTEGTAFTYYLSFDNPYYGMKYAMARVKVIDLADGKRILITSLSDITHDRQKENELKILSETDALTELNNRGSGEKKIEKLLKGGAFGMFCIIDVNKFKHINDTYGHQTGDEALIKIAECLRESFRESDVVMRLGGDEFVVFANGLTTQKVVRATMDKLFKRIDETTLEADENYRMSISVGITFARKAEETSFEALYSKADSVMYKCKENPTSSFEFSD